MDSRARIDHVLEAIETMVEGKLAELHTSEHCRVVSYDPQKQTAVLQPTNKALIRQPDGSTEWVSKPQIPDVKVHFPSGGGLTLTFPIQEGDEVLAVMSSRSPDVWQQNGGEQQIVDTRLHDLSNAFCIPGFRSDANALPSVSTESTQIRTDDGETVIDFRDGTVVLKAQDTTVEARTEKAMMQKGDLKVTVSGSRVDLGGDGGSPVVTLSGPSSKVFAVI